MVDDSKQFCLVSLEDLRTVFNEWFSESQRQETINKTEEKQLYSTNEVLKLLDISRPTLWRWNKTKYLCPIKIGERDNYYKLEDIKRIQGK